MTHPTQNDFNQLIELLKNFPGIGSKAALKMAQHLFETNPKETEETFENILTIIKKIKICSQCLNYAFTDPCQDCLGDNLKKFQKICIIETQLDFFALKKHFEDNTKFHILGGKLSPLNGIGVNELNIQNLLNLIDNTPSIKEIIIALNADTEGETTTQYLIKLLKNKNLTISRLAFGLACTGSIHQSDERSIQKSISSRIVY